MHRMINKKGIQLKITGEITDIFYSLVVISIFENVVFQVGSLTTKDARFMRSGRRAGSLDVRRVLRKL